MSGKTMGLYRIKAPERRKRAMRGSRILQTVGASGRIADQLWETALLVKHEIPIVLGLVRR